jgi:hypothetical protein
MPPFGPDAGARNTLLSVDVQIVDDPDVMSLNWVLEPFVNVPIASNETIPPVGTPPGPPGTLVLVAAARGVSVGVILGDLVGVADGAGVAGVGGGPFEIVIASSAKSGPELVVVPLLLPPEQLSRIAPKTNKTTGVITSHLSHRDNIKP